MAEIMAHKSTYVCICYEWFSDSWILWLLTHDGYGTAFSTHFRTSSHLSPNTKWSQTAFRLPLLGNLTTGWHSNRANTMWLLPAVVNSDSPATRLSSALTTLGLLASFSVFILPSWCLQKENTSEEQTDGKNKTSTMQNIYIYIWMK